MNESPPPIRGYHAHVYFAVEGLDEARVALEQLEMPQSIP